MRKYDTFREVLDVLKVHGHEIMMALYGDEEKCNLKRDFTDEEWETEQHNLMFYSCYEGGDFIPKLFGLKTYDRNATFNSTPIRSKAALKNDAIYHCELNTYNESRDYGSAQVHYFTILVTNVTILVQTYGGVDGILVKYIHGDVNVILNKIISGSGDHYRRLFQVPKDMEHVLNYDFADLKYVKQSLFIPSLDDLNELLQSKGANFAAVAIDYLI